MSYQEHRNMISAGEWLIQTSYDAYRHKGHYNVIDLESSKIVIERTINRNCSDNAIGYIAIAAVLSYCRREDICPTIWCKNERSFEWFLSAKDNSKVLDPIVRNVLDQASQFFRSQIRPGKIKLWQRNDNPNSFPPFDW